MNNKYFLVVQLLFSLCLCKISNDPKRKLLKGFKKYYNSLPNQVYRSEEGSLLSTQQVITSGEQFIAIPRDQPNAPCVGCASHVNPQAAGVSDLANLGVRHLDLHETSVKHSLESVIDVERQVQVENGVRYVLTLSINSNHCTEVQSENCASSKTCKITILVKPWVKLSNGGNYRAILANNCTEEWQYGDNGEIFPELSADNNQIKGNTSMDPSDTTAFDGDIQVKHNINVESQANQERSHTEEDTKNIHEQIINNSQFQEITESSRQSTLSSDASGVSKQHVFKVEAGNQNKNSIPVTESEKTVQAFNINLDKKKAIDEMLDFFDISGFKPKFEAEDVVPRVRRSYDYDLQVLRGKRQLDGGPKDQDPTEPRYKALADESLQKYAIDSGITEPLEVAYVEKVTSQLVSGTVIRIDFLVSGSPNSKTIKCHSEVWEQGWLNFKEIKVSCENDSHLRGKRQDLPGGISEVDPTAPQYKALAEESLRKYTIDYGIAEPLEVVQVERVTTQIVAGSLTRIDFLVSGSPNSKTIKCHSEVWEQGWLNFKEIKVSCENDSHLRGKRQVADGGANQDPTRPRYKALAEESLRKYVIDFAISQPLEVVQVQMVTTHIAAGIVTDIDFLVSGSPNSKTIKCHSEVWEQGWLNFKEIKVSCENDGHRGKRHDLAGETLEKDPTAPEYKALAEESLRKYAIDSGITEPLEVVDVEKVTFQLVSGSLIRIDFLVSGSPNSKTIKCHSEVWEQSWLNFKEIKVSCENDSHLTVKRQDLPLGGISEVDPTEPQYKALAEESLRKYAIDSGITEPLEVAQVEWVTTQIVAGLLTRIDFLVSGSPNSKTIKCHSEIWERDWLNFKEIKVSCENDSHLRGKRQDLPGGISEVDPTAPQYKVLAEESLRKYTIDYGIAEPLEVVKVERVTTQTVAGSLTRIDFLVSGSPNSKTIKCHSEVWEQGWLNFKEIKVSCENDSHLRGKRQVADGGANQDPTRPRYKALAEESLRKYVIDFAISQPLEVVQVQMVTTHIAAGIVTDIDFLVSGGPNSKTIKCHSEVWEQGWLNFKEIKVSCENDSHLRGKRQVADGGANQDPTRPRYKALAEESLRKYVIDFAISQPLEVVQVQMVTTHIVAGIVTDIDFLVSGSPNSKTIKCHSEVWEQGWLNFKEIKVSCENDSHLRGKRQDLLPGGISEVDPTEPQYKALAEESLRKYIIDFAIAQPLEVAQVERVTTQIVAGSLTRIDFLVSGSPNSKTIKCHSEIWERDWLKFKEIKVSCENDSHLTVKRQDLPLGGISEVDPTEPQYKALAEESLRKYAIDSGITEPLEVAQVEWVTTQIVAGLLTRIDFLVSGSPNSKTIKCHSEIWERDWLNFKEIKVSCENDSHLRGKRQDLPGGISEVDPTAPQYKVLAEESLRKYTIDYGIAEPLEVVKVERVTTQTVAGSLTRIDFLVSGSPNSKTIKCHSEVWEQGWLNFKEIKVSCENDSHLRGKRQVADGGANQDPTRPRYKALAEESLRKYVIDFAISQPLEVVQVQMVTTHIAAGIVTDIDFLVSGSPNSKTIKCHSEVWEQGWLNFKEIKVSCENDSHLRGKRQDLLPGGISEVDPTEPQYKALAEESLRKYIIDFAIAQPLEVAQVERVTTQIVAGSLTRIDFLVSGSPNSKTIKCHSEIWERDWLKFKEIKVSCENNSHLTVKRQDLPLGGISEVDPTEPQYKALAEESLRKYAIDSGITEPLEVAQVEWVTTQIVAGLLTRIDFLVSGSPNSKTIKCHSEIWERDWLNFKEIKVSCENDSHLRGKRQDLPGGISEEDPTAPQYKALAEESLRKYTIDYGIAEPLEVVQVERVTTQIVAGSLTRIDFLVSGSPNSKTIKCHSEVWEQGWLNFKEIKVSCENDGHRGKRHDLAGETLEQDPTAPEYKALAEESLRKYAIDSGITEPLEVVDVEKVTFQLVSGSLIRIDFLVSGSPNSKTIKCHSEVWEQSWLNFKEIKVSCENDSHLRGKRQDLPGGISEEDPTAPQYKALAEESLRKYSIDYGIAEPLEVVQVERVTTQIVAGSLTRIDFLVSGSPNSKTIKCHSEVWEQGWLNFKEIKVSCENDGHRGKRHDLAGETLEQDPTAPEYKALAEESLRKYAIDSGITEPLEVVDVEKVTFQLVSGSLIRIDFLVSGSPNSKTIKCHSEVWEQSWLNFKEIKVSCENDSHLRGKRQDLPGGISEEDPTAPQYKALAEESLRKYTIDYGIAEPLEVVQVERVTTQIVAGSLTRIDFLVSGSPNSKTIKCHSEVWEQGWLNFKEIKVSCENDGHRGKRHDLAGETLEQDPTAPEYKALAEESLRKYAIDSGITEPLEVVDVEKVTFQLVSGSLIRIDFLVSGSPNSKTIKCHSEVWEQSWLNFKEIKVSCENDSHLRGKRQDLPGGISEEDPTAPQYKALAEESLRKYSIDYGIAEPLEVVQVERVTTQIVAGSLTRIDFLVSGSPNSKTIKCHSEVWEQGWLNFKEIKVSCENDGHRGKRHDLAGETLEQDPTAPEYKALAEESLRKYAIDSGITEPLEVADVEKVTFQLVSGSLIRIDFLVSGSPNSKTIKCHSEVWEQSWLNFKEIKVSCENDSHLRGKRQDLPGGISEEDPTAPQYKALAEESLRKYTIDYGIAEPLEVVQVERVTTQIVAGSLTRIDFLVSGSPNSKTIKCHSEVWEQGWLNFKEIKVSCENDSHLRGKRQDLPGGISEVDPTAPQYKALAEESLRKYITDFSIAQPLEVAQVERVTTQIVAGSLTRIDFLVSGIPNSKTIKCHSEIWERDWLNFKEIKVSCENDSHLRGKRQDLPGGISEVDPTAPQYKALAEESLRKHITDFSIAQPLEVAQVERVTTQIVAGSLTRIDFLVSPSSLESETIKCHSEVWEQGWRNFKEIKVSCENLGHRGKRQDLPGGISEEDPTAPQYKALAEESLRKYAIDSGITEPLEVAQVERVTTQIVAGSLTRIDFLVSGSSLESETIKCHSEVWEQGWRNFKEIKVSCENLGHRGKRRDLPGGISEEDPTAPQYKALAEESLRKYITDFSIAQPLEVAQVEWVTTQIVAGLLTRIDFLVSGSPNSKTIKCHSEIWERGWLNFKKIEVSCENDSHLRGKRQDLPLGGISEVDPTEPQYKALAEESLRKYAIDSGITEPLEVAQVEWVTTQIVAGLLTRIDFLVSGSPNSKTIKCHSEIWERDWLNFKEIKVSCENDSHLRGKRQDLPGGISEVDPTAPQYKALAEESLRKYITDFSIAQPLEVAQVERVTTQIVAGSLTRIDFLVSGSSLESETIKCHSEVWEQGWRNFKEIKVSCENLGHRGKRQDLPGGISEEDPTAPQYKALAEESLRKYITDSSIAQPLEVAQVEWVTTQIVAGLLTRIDFLVSGSPNSKTIKCHSEIWERGWLNFKKIEVSCENDSHLRGKRQDLPLGGISEVDPTEPQYKALAEESLRKYAIDSGITEPLEVAQVERVTTQIVAGSLTRIDFLVSPSSLESETIKCHSEVWEQGWRNFKEIKVSCENLGHRGKRQDLPGGISEEDPTAPQYKALAEESLRKYAIDSGITEPLEVAQVERVTTQIVAGSLTRIDFLVSGSSLESETIKCHSEVWEQGWRNFKEIKVSCENLGHRGKRRDLPGGISEEDPTAPQYKALAEESLRKYITDFSIAQPLEVAQVEWVTTQIVAGLLTRIDFLVSGSPNSKTIKCHSEIWERGWLNFKKIEVSCENDSHLRGKRQDLPLGGISEVDPTEPQYKALAEESLRKYAIDSGITEPLEVAQVERVTTQIVAGSLTRIDFLVSPSSLESETIKCHSEVWEQGWRNFKEIKVSCENLGHRGKRQDLPGGISEEDPTAPQFKALAEESLRKYITDFSIAQPLEVAQVERVTTQIVAGSLTRIDFLVSGSSLESETIKCHSEVWEQGWRNFKEIKVSCENLGHRGKRQDLPGGISEEDPTAPQYKALAEESLRKYITDFSIAQPLEVAQVEWVTTQIVAGLLTRIDFLVSGSPNSKTIKCHSEIWERGWLNFKKIEVSCENDSHLRGKRQDLPLGGISEVDPTEPQYKALAEESLRKYAIDSGITEPLEVAQVERVTTQIVAGSLTRIDFLVSPSSLESETIKCHSEVWEQGWRNFKEIKVSCENLGHRGKRQDLPGGISEEDPTAPQYKALAEESLRKYAIDSGITEPLEVAQVERVTTQIVAGLLTRIDFLVSGSPNSKTIKCHSEIWERGWLNFKEIKVSCGNDSHLRLKRQDLADGISEVGLS